MLKRWFFYALIFGIGYAVAFFGIRMLSHHKSTPSTPFVEQQDPSSELPIADTEPSPPESSDDTFESIQEDIDMTVDITLPSLSAREFLSPSKLKAACSRTYPQYRAQTRYEWARSYMGFRTRNKHSLEYYITDDEIWQHFSDIQKNRLMEDLIYCDPVSQLDRKISLIRVLSSRDSSELSRYSRKGEK